MVMSKLPFAAICVSRFAEHSTSSKVFKRTTATYKFLWFLAILDLVKESEPTASRNLVFSTQDICARMVAKSCSRLSTLNCLSGVGIVLLKSLRR